MFGTTVRIHVDNHPYLLVRQGSGVQVFAGNNEEPDVLLGSFSFDPGPGGRAPTASVGDGGGHSSSFTSGTARGAIEKAVRFLAAGPKARTAQQVHQVPQAIH